jgi:hypothetical protein
MERGEAVRMIGYRDEYSKDTMVPGLIQIPAAFPGVASVRSGSRIFAEDGTQVGVEAWDLRFAGFEDVEVPAGTFEECLRVEFRYVRDGGYGAESGRGSDWYARGVGLVKSVWRDGSVSGLRELVEIEEAP